MSTATIIRKPPTGVTILRRTATSATVTTVGGSTGPRGVPGHGSFATLSDVVDWSTRAEGDVPVVDADGNLRPGTPAAGSGVPDGGTTGQVLTKESGADGDADWEDPASGGGSPTGPAGGVLSGTYPDPGFADEIPTFTDLNAGLALKVDDHNGSHDGALQVEPDAGETTVLARADRQVVVKVSESGDAAALALIAATTPVADGDPGALVGGVLQLDEDSATLGTNAHALLIDAAGVKVDSILLDDLYDADGAAAAGDAAHVAASDPHTQYQKESERGASNGYAPLDASGLLPTANLPPLAITSVQTVGSQAAMLALTAEPGDVAYRTDTSTFYILAAAPASTLANWLALTSPSGVVTVDGRSGTVTLTDLYDALGAATSAVSTHTAAVDPHGDRAFATAGDAAEASARSSADATLTTSVAGKVAKAGDTMTGALVASSDPVAELQMVARRYSDAGAKRATAGLLQKLAQNVADLNVVWVGNSIDVDWLTSFVEASQQVGSYIGAQFPAYTVKIGYYDAPTDLYGSETTLVSGAGANTLHIWMAAITGTRLDYWTGSRIPHAITDKTPDLLIVAHSMNEGAIDASQTYEQVRSRMAAGLNVLSNACEGVPVLVIAQHKRYGSTEQELKARALAEIASSRGFGFVDICKAFLDDGRSAGTLTLDNVHLTQAGHDLYAATLKPLFSPVGPQLQPLGVPTLQGGLIANLARNGLFQDLLTTGQTVATGVTNGTTTISTTPAYLISAAFIGAPISGTDIPSGTTITAVNTVLGQATLSAAATGSHTGITFTIGQAPPANWSSTNATLTKDTTNPPAGQTYGLRIQAASAAATSISQVVLDSETVKSVRGKYVSVSVQMRVANTQTGAGIGQIRLADGVNTKNSVVSTVGPFDAYAPRTLTMKVDAAATALTLTVFADTASNASADITVGSVTVVPGMLPRDVTPIASVEVTGKLGVKGDFHLRRSFGANSGTLEVGDPTSLVGQVFSWALVLKYRQLLTGAFNNREDGYSGTYYGGGATPPDLPWPLVVGAAISAGAVGYNLTFAFDTIAGIPDATTDTQALNLKVGKRGARKTTTFSGTTLSPTTGALYSFTGSAATVVTLPALATAAADFVAAFHNRGTAIMTVQRAGSDTLSTPDGTAVTSVIVPPGGWVEVTDDGVSWLTRGRFVGSKVPALFGSLRSGDTTVAGTTTLTEDLHADTLNVTGTLACAGFRVFCRRLKGNGVIHNDGGSSTVGSAGAASHGVNAGYYKPGTAGGAGGTAAGSGGGAVANNRGIGAAGGAGGLGTGGAGGAAGTYSAITAAPDMGTATPAALDAYTVRLGRVSSDGGGASSWLALEGGSGGGGGGGDGTTGGGGGGAGGVCVVFAYDATEWLGTIRANGGNGGTPAAGNRGGGGGGGAGFAGFFYNYAPAGSYTVQALGGTHGNKTGTGIDGSDGQTGSLGSTTIDRRVFEN